jgi:hypothetical protein
MSATRFLGAIRRSRCLISCPAACVSNPRRTADSPGGRVAARGLAGAAVHELDAVWLMPADPMVVAQIHLAWVRLVQGDLSAAEAELAGAGRRAEQLSSPRGPYNLAYPRFMLRVRRACGRAPALDPGVVRPLRRRPDQGHRTRAGARVDSPRRRHPRGGAVSSSTRGPACASPGRRQIVNKAVAGAAISTRTGTRSATTESFRSTVVLRWVRDGRVQGGRRPATRRPRGRLPKIVVATGSIPRSVKS